MALPPSLWPARLINQSFGMCITPNDYILPLYNTYNANYYRPWTWCIQDVVKDFGSTIDNSKDSFKLTLDVQHFRPEEISVKVANNQILVEGKHEERKDEHGFVARQFTRRHALPDNCMADDVISSLSSDGVLSVMAKKKSANELKMNEKNVPIQLCKSCPMKEQANIKTIIATKQKDGTDEIQKDDGAKKNTQIILKEDHCCLLLKPELLQEVGLDNTEVKSEMKKEREAQIKSCEQATKNTSDFFCEQATKNTVEMLEQSFSKHSSVMSTSATIPEQALVTSSAAMATTSGEEVGQSSMSSSQISEITDMCSKTSEYIEPATSYKSCVTANIQEMNEDLSDFVSDILCSELDQTQSDKK